MKTSPDFSKHRYSPLGSGTKSVAASVVSQTFSSLARSLARKISLQTFSRLHGWGLEDEKSPPGFGPDEPTRMVDQNSMGLK